MTHRPFALAAILISFSPSDVLAAPVFFVNLEGPGRHFVSTNSDITGLGGGFIDVTKPANQQPLQGSDPLPASAFSWTYILDEDLNPIPGSILGGPWKASTIPGGTELGFMWSPPTFNLIIKQFGDTIADGPFNAAADLGLLSHLLPGDTTGFLGVRFALWNAAGTDFTTHFGWMQVDWLGQGLTGGVDLDLLAWGYETTPDTPIAAGAGLPAPGGAIVLTLAGVCAARRRRRA